MAPILSVEETLLRAVREDIVRLNLAPGTRLRMADVAARAGVSLTPARQVLRRLEADGLVLSYPRTGSRVAPLSWADAELVMTVSGALERRLVGIGVPALTDEDLAQISSLLADREAAVKARNIDELDRTGLGIRDAVYRRANRPELYDEAIRWRYREQRYSRHAVLSGLGNGLSLGSEVTAFAAACMKRDAEGAEQARQKIEEGVLATLMDSLTD